MDIPALSATVSPVSALRSTEGRGIHAREEGAGPAESRQADTALRELQQTDAAVRRHEQAHLAAAGGLALGAAGFSYERGSDGRLYAIGGEVSIDVSAEATPEATLAKAQQIRAAALAPADPSAQDRAVAAMAGRMEMEARLEMARAARGAAGDEATGGTAGGVKGLPDEAVDAGQGVTATPSSWEGAPDAVPSPGLRESNSAVAAYQAVQDAAEVTRALVSAFA